MERDWHDYKKRFEGAMKEVRTNNEISERNRSLILDFISHCQAESLSAGRMARYAWILKNLAKWLMIDFDKAEKKDIERLVIKIETAEYKPFTKQLYKVTIKKFYKWMVGGEEYPQTVRWVKTAVKHADSRLPEEILTEEDIKKLIDAAEQIRDKAFISMLYESGCRIKEIALVKLKHVVLDEYGAQIIVDGKTGMRRIRLIASVPYLSAWINVHPQRKDADSPLWICVGTRDHGKELKYESIKSLLVSAAMKAGVTKRVNPHSFRHARATHLSKHLKEFQMNQHFGWVQGSDMPRTYVHLSGRDMDDSLLELYGIKKKNENKEMPLKPKICEICGYTNAPTNGLCGKCGRPLDVKIAMEIENKKAKDESFTLKLVEMPGVLEQFLANADEKEIEELMRTHPNLVTKLTLIAVRNVNKSKS
ncbi:MAG: tyrosine-type recombinase/integrase [Nitrosopumilaceae archaeon]